MNTTAVIRQRGQLTIPDEIRRFLTWLVSGSVVSVTVKDNELIVKPYVDVKELKWKSLWEKMEIVNGFPNKTGNLSKFVIEDRDNRR